MSTIRNLTEFRTGIVFVGLMMLTALYFAFVIEPSSRLGDDVGLVSILTAVSFVVWHVMVRPRVEIFSGFLIVTNWFVQYKVPMATLEDVESDPKGLMIRTLDGGLVRLASSSTSLISDLKGNRLQIKMREAILQAKQEESAADARFADSFDKQFKLRALPFLAFLVVCISATILRHG